MEQIGFKIREMGLNLYSLLKNSLIKSFNLIYHDAKIWQLPNEGGAIAREEATKRTYVLLCKDGANRTRESSAAAGRQAY
jgi:hypothetical protein